MQVGKESPDIQHWASDCLPQSLQSIFLNKDRVNDSCVIAILHILLSIKDIIQTKDWRNMKIIFHCMFVYKEKSFEFCFSVWKVNRASRRLTNHFSQVGCDSVVQNISPLHAYKYLYLPLHRGSEMMMWCEGVNTYWSIFL